MIVTAAMPGHDLACAGHHCIVCGDCLAYDPKNEDFWLDGEDELDAATCEECQEKK